MKMNKLAFLGFSLVLGACGHGEPKYPSGLDRTTTHNDIYGKRDSIFGENQDLLSFLGVTKNKTQNPALGMSIYLWRGALDTVSYMPLASVDPQGGLIITDWYMERTNIGKRFKANILISGKDINSDNLKVTVFQQYNKNGDWLDDPAATQTAASITAGILKRAKELKAVDARK